MPLIYVSEEINSTITRFKEYLLHYSFSHIYSLNSTIRNDDWGFPSTPEYLEREKTFIPVRFISYLVIRLAGIRLK